MLPVRQVQLAPAVCIEHSMQHAACDGKNLILIESINQLMTRKGCD